MDVLSGKESHGKVDKTDTSRVIHLDRAVHGATTLTIGLEKPTSRILNFLGMYNEKNHVLLTLGTALANALSPKSRSPAHPALMGLAQEYLRRQTGHPLQADMLSTVDSTLQAVTQRIVRPRQEPPHRRGRLAAQGQRCLLRFHLARLKRAVPRRRDLRRSLSMVTC